MHSPLPLLRKGVFLGITVLLLMVSRYTANAYYLTHFIKQVTASNNAYPVPSLKPAPALIFTQNVGQWTEKVRFQADIPQGTLFVTDNALWLTVVQIPDPDVCRQDESEWNAQDRIAQQTTTTCIKRGVNIRLEFLNANAGATITAFDRSTSNSSYFIGNKKDNWQANVPSWGGVRYENLYPNLDLVLTHKNGLPVFQWVLKDNNFTALNAIQLHIEGGNSLRTDGNNLIMPTAMGVVTLPLFEVVTPDGSPVTNLPAPHITDNTLTTPFRRSLKTHPTSAATEGEADPLPSNLIASTFLGGSHYDWGRSVARDIQGNIYVFGETSSIDFPTTPGAWQTTSPSDPPYYNLFISKFSPDLSQLLHSTYLGSTSDDYAKKITVDQYGGVYLTGYHRGSDFPTTEHTWDVNNQGSTGYAVKMAPQLDTLIYVVFLGGEDSDIAYDVAVDAEGAAYIAGTTRSPDFLVTEGAFDTTFNMVPPNNNNDGFITKIKPDGSWMDYSTFLGGVYPDVMYGIDVDRDGNAYVTGTARSEDYPTTPDAFSPQSGGLLEGVVTKLSPDGSTLVYSTYLGGSGLRDEPAAIKIDDEGYAYVTGSTQSENFPVTEGAYDMLCGDTGPCRNPDTGDAAPDGFLTKFNQTGSELVYSTYFGLRGDDEGIDLALDREGNAYVLGYVHFPAFELTPGAYSRGMGASHAFLKFNSTGTALLHGTYFFSDSNKVILADENWLYTVGTTLNTGFPTTANAYDRTCGTDGTCNYVYNPEVGGIAYTDATVSAMVLPSVALTITLGLEGGTLAGGEDQIGYTFPTNTFTDTIVFTHAPRHPLSMPPVVALSHVNRAFANYAVLSDTNTLVSPTQPYSLSITYEEGDLTTDEATLALYYWDGVAWVMELSGVLNTATNTITATPSRVGWWVVLGEARRQFLPLLYSK